MNVTTFLRNRRRSVLLNKLNNLQKLSANYLQSAEDCYNLNANCSSYYCNCNFQNCYFNSFLENTYHSDVFYSNYMHFRHMHIITERRIKKIKKKLESL